MMQKKASPKSYAQLKYRVSMTLTEPCVLAEDP